MARLKHGDCHAPKPTLENIQFNIFRAEISRDVAHSCKETKLK